MKLENINFVNTSSLDLYFDRISSFEIAIRKNYTDEYKRNLITKKYANDLSVGKFPIIQMPQHKLSSFSFNDNFQNSYICDSAFIDQACLSCVTFDEKAMISVIPQMCFYNCYSLTSIELPPNIQKIENSAFYNCSSLLSVLIPANTYSIGDCAFYGCKNLQHIEIMSNCILSTGKNIFKECINLSTVKFKKTNKQEILSIFLN